LFLEQSTASSFFGGAEFDTPWRHTDGSPPYFILPTVKIIRGNLNAKPEDREGIWFQFCIMDLRILYRALKYWAAKAAMPLRFNLTVSSALWTTPTPSHSSFHWFTTMVPFTITSNP